MLENCQSIYLVLTDHGNDMFIKCGLSRWYFIDYSIFERSHMPGFYQPHRYRTWIWLTAGKADHHWLFTPIVWLTYSQQIIGIFQELGLFQVSLLETHLGGGEGGGGVREPER